MRFLFLALLSFVPPAPAATPSSPAPRLLVRGDDMGFSHAANLALVKAYTDGIERSIELMAPTPWFPEAVTLLASLPDVDVGVHLTLTSEWDNVKWRPLTDCPSLVDADGFFFPMVWPNPDYPGRALKENAWKLDEIEREFRAQIELVRKHVPQASHVSGHMGCSRIDPLVRDLVARLAQEYGLTLEPDAQSVTPIGFTEPRKTTEQKIAGFLALIPTLARGKTYLFIDHPAYDSPELRAVHHIGYEAVAEDREGVVACWTDPRVRKAIVQQGIELISYRDLHP